MNRAERRALVEREAPALPVSRQCRLLAGNHPAKATGESRLELLRGVGDRRRRLAPVPGQQLV
jgi:hypothetical protein